MRKIQVSIPKPCQENWNDMTPGQQGRFCASCQKAVIDFTHMSDRQLAEFFKRPASSVCGRFYPDQLNREIEATKKRIPWIRYFFQIALPAFLVTMKAGAQKSKVLMGDTTYCTPTMGLVSSKRVNEKNSEVKNIRGQIMDAEGNKIPFATVIIKNSNTGTQADAEGRFELGAPPHSVLIFSAVGYQAKEIRVNDELTDLVFRFDKNDEALAGAVVVGYAIRKKTGPIPLVKKVSDTAFRKFSVYPNPVQRNSAIKIDGRKLKAGVYTIGILTMNGQVIQTEEREFRAKDPEVELVVKDMVAGVYFIRLFHQKTAASYTEKIIIR